MSKVLSKMLGESELVIGTMIEKLETLSGFESQDLRLLDEVATIIRQKTSELGLDPKDTVPKELYYSLSNRFANDCEAVENLYHNKTNFRRLRQVTKVALSVQHPREVWAIKHSVAKSILRANPPKSLMRALGYRSLESMLKHEATELLFAAATSVASERWNEKLSQQYTKLSPLDFETRKMAIIVPKTKEWHTIALSIQSISSIQPLGAVVIWDNSATRKTPALALLALCLQALDNLYKSNLVIKSNQTARNFGNQVQKIWANQSPHAVSLAGIGLQWRSVFHHLAKQPPELYPEALEPHIVPEHLALPSLGHLLAYIHPQLNWWRNNDYALLGRGRNQTSLNVIDVATNLAQKNEFGQNSVYAGRQSLWDELASRYMNHPNVFDRVINQVEAGLSPMTAIRVESKVAV